MYVIPLHNMTYCIMKIMTIENILDKSKAMREIWYGLKLKLKSHWWTDKHLKSHLICSDWPFQFVPVGTEILRRQFFNCIELCNLRSLSHGFLTTSILNVLLRLYNVSSKFEENLESTCFVICLKLVFYKL